MAGTLGSVSGANDVDVIDIQIPMYSVILYNDDYTTFDFVIEVLRDIFGMSASEAESVTMTVHTRGRGVAGRYPREIAETKVSEVHARAAVAGFPLRAGIEG